MKKRLVTGFVLLVCFFACEPKDNAQSVENDQPTNDLPSDSAGDFAGGTTKKKDSLTVEQRNPDSIKLVVFAGGMNRKKNGIPQTQILLAHRQDTTKGAFREIEIDSTYNFTPLHRDQFEALHIPQNAHFAYKSYYGGHGYRVYGMVDQQKEELKLYEQEYFDKEPPAPYRLTEHYDVSYHDFYSLNQ